MKRRIMALCLTCTLLLTTAALAAQDSILPPQPAGGNHTADTDNIPVTPGPAGSLSFDQIRTKVENNPNIKAAQEGLKAAQAMDWSTSIKDLEDAIDDMEFQVSLIQSSSNANLNAAQENLDQVIESIKTSQEFIKNINQLSSAIAGVSSAQTLVAYGQAQKASLEATKESLEDQLDDLLEQRDDYKKTLEDTARQVEYAKDQTASGAQSLYLNILSTQLQLDALNNTIVSTRRTLQEMDTRYNLGQISQLTLTQVKNGYDKVVASVPSLETAIFTMKSSLQSLLGDTPNGQLTLTNTPTVTSVEVDSLRYEKDLEKAKKNSYTLYSSTRAVENAEDDMYDAQRDEGRNSYQYKMAEHTYQSAIYQNDAAIANFEVAFQNLYKAIAPAQAALTTAETELAYQERLYAVAELKHQLGNLSANALQDAKDAMENAKRDMLARQLDLFTAYHSYQQAVELGLVNSGS